MRTTSLPLPRLLPVLFAVGCAPTSSGQMGTGLPGAMAGPEVRVDEALPSVLDFPRTTVEDLWRVLPATFQALGIPAGILDAGSMVYGNDRVTQTTVAGKATRDLFRCGSQSGLAVGSYRVEFGITAQPRKTPDGGAELFVQTLAAGRLVSGSRAGVTHCVSDGTLEAKIKEQVALELARRGGWSGRGVDPSSVPTPRSGGPGVRP